MHEYYAKNAPKLKNAMNGLLKPMEYWPPVFEQGKGYK